MHRLPRSRRQHTRSGGKPRVKTFSNTLLEPIEKGHVSEVMAAVSREDKRIPTEHLDEALLRAAGYGQAELCALLLQTGADPNVHEEREAFMERLEMVPSFTGGQAVGHAWLQHHGAVAGSALHRAAEGGHAATVGVLLAAGARPNEVDDNGVTPLMVACMRRGYRGVVRRLLFTPGCSVNTTEKRVGRTAVHFAAHVGDLEVLKLLLDNGGEVDTRDHLQNTPLMLATTPVRYEEPGWPPENVDGCITLLIDGGAFVNLVNKDSESALQRALEIQKGSAVEVLLSHNALTHPAILRDACLAYKDVRNVQTLLATGGGYGGTDQHLAAILICLICDDSSQWMLNAKSHERVTHEIARHVITAVRDWSAVEELHVLGEKDVQHVFGEEYVIPYEDRYKTDVAQFGLFGAALKHGKYSVARMLFLAGCDLTRMQQLRESSLCEYLMKHSALCTWLPQALTPAAGDEEEGEHAGEDRADDNTVVQKKNGGRLSDVQPFDVIVRENEDTLLNQFYSKREESQAARQQTLWLYQ